MRGPNRLPFDVLKGFELPKGPESAGFAGVAGAPKKLPDSPDAFLGMLVQLDGLDALERVPKRPPLAFEVLAGICTKTPRWKLDVLVEA